MAVSLLDPNFRILTKADIEIDTQAGCLTALKGIQKTRKTLLNSLDSKLNDNGFNPPIENVRVEFERAQKTLKELNDLKDFCKKSYTWEPTYDGLFQKCCKKQFLLDGRELTLISAARKKGWTAAQSKTPNFPITKPADIRVDTQDNCLYSLETAQVHRSTLLSSLELKLSKASSGATPPAAKVELEGLLQQMEDVGNQTRFCLEEYERNGWTPNEQHQKCCLEQLKLSSRQDVILKAAAKMGLSGGRFVSKAAGSQSKAPILANLDAPVINGRLVDTQANCLRSLKVFQSARLRLLDCLQDQLLDTNPNISELERLLRQAEKFRNLSHFCFDRYRWTGEVTSHDNQDHKDCCKEQARLDSQESTIFGTIIERGLLERTVRGAFDLSPTEKVSHFCKTHFLVPLGLAASIAAHAELIPMDNPLGSMAPALAGALASLFVDPKGLLIDTLDLGNLVLNSLAKKAVPIGIGLSAIAYYKDEVNLTEMTYFLALAALLQMGSQYKTWKSALSIQNLANSALKTTKSWFQYGYKTGVIAGVVSGALSHICGQSFSTNCAFGVGVYAVHAGFASLMRHANNRNPI